MSPYLRHLQAIQEAKERLGVADCNQRLAWLYGDVLERLKVNAPDVKAWRNLGGRNV